MRPRTPVIPIRTPHVAYLDHLPWHHKDPYDRILMPHSVVEKMPLVTADEEIRKYRITLGRHVIRILLPNGAVKIYDIFV